MKNEVVLRLSRNPFPT